VDLIAIIFHRIIGNPHRKDLCGFSFALFTHQIHSAFFRLNTSLLELPLEQEKPDERSTTKEVWAGLIY
jgi:hypothetical protein